MRSKTVVLAVLFCLITAMPLAANDSDYNTELFPLLNHLNEEMGYVEISTTPDGYLKVRYCLTKPNWVFLKTHLDVQYNVNDIPMYRTETGTILNPKLPDFGFIDIYDPRPYYYSTWYFQTETWYIEGYDFNKMLAIAAQARVGRLYLETSPFYSWKFSECSLWAGTLKMNETSAARWFEYFFEAP